MSASETTELCHNPYRGDRNVLCVLPANHSGDHDNGNGNTWCNYGPVQQYEVTWMSGYMETIYAHQVLFPHIGTPRFQFHREIDGRLRLVLSAREEDIRTIRNTTDGEYL